MLRAAIVGCGGIASVHKRVLTGLPEAELIACCDIKKGKAEAFAEGSNMRVYESIEDLIEKEKPDVVHLCVPHPLHAPMAKYCVENGVNVFTEKPPVVNAAQWDMFYQLKDADKYVGICFQNRYNHSVKRVKEMIDSGEMGRVLGARAILTWNRDADYYSKSDWRGNWKTEGGGVLINQAIHTLDLLVYLLGKVENADCHMCNHSLREIIEVEDTAEAYIRFESGVNACFYATNAYCMNSPVMVELVMQKGILRMEGDSLTVQFPDGSAKQMEITNKPRFEKDYWGNSHYDCISDFYKAIIEKRPFNNDIEHVKETMKLMINMYEAFAGKRIPAC